MYHSAKWQWGPTRDFVPPFTMSWGQEFRHWTTSLGWELLTSALCSSLQWEISHSCQALLCPQLHGLSPALSSGFSLPRSSHTFWEHLPTPSDFSFHPTTPNPFFPLFLPQFPWLLYQHLLPKSTCLSAVVTCPDKGSFIHFFEFWRA